MGRVRDTGPRSYRDPRKISRPLGSGPASPLSAIFADFESSFTSGLQQSGFQLDPFRIDFQPFEPSFFPSDPVSMNLPQANNPIGNNNGWFPRVAPARAAAAAGGLIKGLPLNRLMGGAQGVAPGGQATYKVMVSNNDAVPDYLKPKLPNYAAFAVPDYDNFDVSWEELNGGANEDLRLKVSKANTAKWFITRQGWSPADGGGKVGLCRVKANPYNLDTSTETDDETVVYLWVPFEPVSGLPTAGQPNLHDNQLFRAVQGEDGDWYGLPGDYLDDPVGTIKMWALSDGSFDPIAVPAGWFLCNGTSDTIDLKAKFVLSYNEDAGGGGLAEDMEDSAGTVDHIHDAHSTHTHTVATAVDTQIEGTTGSDTFNMHTAEVVVTNNAAGTDVTQHTTEEHLPPYVVLAFIQRVDNESVAWT